MAIFICIQCNKEYKAFPSKKRKFCSKKCAGIYYKDIKRKKMKERWENGEFDNYNWKSFITDEEKTNRSKRRSLENKKMIGEKHPKWKGGFFIKDSHIYNWLERDYEHRVIAKKILNRDLLPNEIVHHIDEDKLNNNPNNLMVIPSSIHCKFHRTKDKSILANYQNLYEISRDHYKDH